MKKSLYLFLAVLAAAGAASAFDGTPIGGHKTGLATNRSAFCGTPSGRLSKECTQTAANMQAPRRWGFQR